MNGIDIIAKDTWSEGIAFPFVHSKSLRNVVEFGQPTKLFPYGVVVVECLHGISNISYQTLESKSEQLKKNCLLIILLCSYFAFIVPYILELNISA